MYTPWLNNEAAARQPSTHQFTTTGWEEVIPAVAGARIALGRASAEQVGTAGTGDFTLCPVFLLAAPPGPPPAAVTPPGVGVFWGTPPGTLSFWVGMQDLFNNMPRYRELILPNAPWFLPVSTSLWACAPNTVPPVGVGAVSIYFLNTSHAIIG